MNANIEFPSLRRVSRALLFDVACMVLLLALVGAQTVAFKLFGTETEGFANILLRVDSYIVWTLRALRLVMWTMMVEALARLSPLEAGYDKARFWYVLRILIFAVFTVLSALSMNRGRRALSCVATLSLPAACLMSLEWLIEVAMVTLGNKRILDASAVLLSSLGMPSEAERNRRTGRRLRVGAVGLLVAVPAGLIAAAIRHLTETDDGDILWTIVAILWIAFGAYYLIGWASAALGTRRAYVLVRELSK